MIPKLPGYVPTQDIERTFFGKTSQAKLLRHGEVKPKPIPLPIEIKELAQMPQPEEEKENVWNTTSQTTFKNPFGASYNPAVSEAKEVFVLSMQQAVLKFQGCFFENLVFNNLEKVRIRKVMVYFYLEDNSIAVVEPKQRNSGIPQGNLLKRQCVRASDGAFYGVRDLSIGGIIELCGVKYLLYACDKFTREFFEKVGAPLGPDREVEKDEFERKVLDAFVARTNFGLNSSVFNGRVPSQKQFLENDRKVLRFYIVSGDDFVLNYYLADDSVEVREVKQVNSGKDPFPMLLKRQKIPTEYGVGLPGIPLESRTFHLNDIRPGVPLKFLNRIFTILSCDKFTQDFMAKRGLAFPLKEDTEDPEPERPAVVYPPHNGFGDEQDSLGNVFRLVPKVPKKDYFSMIDERTELRFVSRLVTDRLEDLERRFVITFYLGDKTLMIYEKQIRNSGFGGGKFLEKMKYKNPNSGEFYEPVDFLVGKIVEINKHLFKIVNCDEKTKEWVRNVFGVEVSAIES